jgi:hypothetical protein
MLAGLLATPALSGNNAGKDKRPGTIPTNVQARIDGIAKHAKSNNVDGVRSEYLAIDWRQVEQQDVAFKAVAKALPKGKDAKALRREIATKYALLREEADDPAIEDLADVEAYQINIVYAPTVKLAPLIVDALEVTAMRFYPISASGLTIAGLLVSYIDAQGVTIPYVDAHGIPVLFLRIADEKYEQAMSTWSRRWNIALDAVGTDGIRIIPHPYTALGLQRSALMRAIERDGWTTATEALWSQYYADLSAAIYRRGIH